MSNFFSIFGGKTEDTWLLAYHNVNISEYGKVTPFLKQNQVGYKLRKAKIFSKEQIDKFLLTAPNEFLMKMVWFEIYF